MSQVPGQEQIHKNDSAGKQETDQTLAENVQSSRSGDAPRDESRRTILLESDEEQVQGQRQPKRDHDVGDEDPCEDVRTESGGDNQCGIETAGVSINPPSPRKCNQQKR